MMEAMCVKLVMEQELSIALHCLSQVGDAGSNASSVISILSLVCVDM